MNLKIPREPGAGVFDFRIKPTRISALKGPHGWGISEWSEGDLQFGERFKSRYWELDARVDWKIIYQLGMRLVRVLAGRTIAEANLENIPACDFAGALAVMREDIPWMSPRGRDMERDAAGKFIAQIKFRRNARAARMARRPDGGVRPLTLRERQVLELLCSGAANKDVARALAIHPRTVESHRTSLYRKCGCSTVAPLVRWAIRQKLIEP